MMKQRSLLILVSACMLSILSGCTGFPAREGNGTQVELTFLREQNESVRGEVFLTVGRIIEGSGKGELARNALDSLRTPPSACVSPFQNGVELSSVSLEGNSATIDLSGEFQDLSGLQKSLITASFIKSLCSIDGIDYVRITSNREPIKGRRDRYLSTFDLVFSADSFTHVRYDATIYFPDAERKALTGERRLVTTTQDETVEEAIVGAVLSGMQEKGVYDLMFPKGARLLSAEVKNAVCYLDFTGEFSALSDDYGKLLIYSLVDSLCRLEYVREVQFLLDGETVSSLGGVNVEKPIEADYKIVV